MFTSLAPGKVSITALTNGSSSAAFRALSSAARRASRKVGAAISLVEMVTSPRAPVHSLSRADNTDTMEGWQ